MSGSRAKKNRRVQSIKKIPWRMTKEILAEYQTIAVLAGNSEYLSDDWHQAMEALKSLPGYPLEASATLDDGELLQPILVDNPFSVVH